MKRTPITKQALLLLVAICVFANDFLEAQIKPLPVVVTCRKSLLGGSYVLQVQNPSDDQLNLWLNAKEKTFNFQLPAKKMKEIGWAQGFRFDANDVFFISADGYDTVKQVIPSAELSPWRIGFSSEGGLAINLSQSFLQDRLPSYLKLPIKDSYSNIIEVAITEMPMIVLQDGSNKIYAKAIVHTSWFSGKVNVPVNITVSFVPRYEPSTGKFFATDIKVEQMDVQLIPQDWLAGFTEVVNRIIAMKFSQYELFQLDKNILKYARFFNVRKIVIHQARVEILLL